MTQVDAIYQDGVFKPLQTVELPENRRVRLSIQPVEADNVRAWLDEVRQFQQRLIAERGCFPDSALDIAEDRQRSVTPSWIAASSPSGSCQSPTPIRPNA